MKKSKIKLLKICNVFFAALISILGFASTSCNDNESPVEYGSPHAKFIVNGKVTDKTTGTPIPHIQVVMKNDEPMYSDTTFTNNEGNYQIADDNGFPTNQNYKLYFRDVDGDTNGNYAEVDSVAKFVDPAFTNGTGWYSGETSQELNIKMTSEE